MEKKKNYQEPKLELVRTDERNRVFFAASGGGPALGGSIKSFGGGTGSWG